MEIAFELAELSMTGDMRETYNKAIFKTDKQKALSSDSVYEDNLVTQVQDISLPSINVISENISDKNKPIIISKERTIKSKTSRKRNIMESNIDRERVIEILQREGQITCQGITLKVDEFNSMTREEQDNFIKCY
jgi:protease II